MTPPALKSSALTRCHGCNGYLLSILSQPRLFLLRYMSPFLEEEWDRQHEPQPGSFMTVCTRNTRATRSKYHTYAACKGDLGQKNPRARRSELQFHVFFCETKQQKCVIQSQSSYLITPRTQMILRASGKGKCLGKAQESDDTIR